MNKLVGTKASERGAPLILLALFGFLMCAGSAFAADAIKDTYRVSDGGQTLEFEVARDQIHVVAPNANPTTRAIAPLASAEAVRQEAIRLAAANDETVQVILYPKGVQRNEFSRRIVTSQVLVKLTPGTDAAALAAGVGAQAGAEVHYAKGFYIFEAGPAGRSLIVADALKGMPGVLSADVMLAKKFATMVFPNDPLFTNQWHLLNTGQSNALAGLDINVTNVWETFTGKGVNIGVVDSGTQVAHPDLFPNAQTQIDYDYNFNDSDPSPGPAGDPHGTAVAGVAAGKGQNGIGITGVAYDAGIVGLRLIGFAITDSQIANALGHSNQVVHVSNNSWGPVLFGFLVGGAGPLATAALEDSVANGRGGNGSVFVFAAGNGDFDMENVNYNSYANAIQTIAVGALNNIGGKADYSTPGAALVVSAPSGGEVGFGGRRHATTTADMVGALGYNDGTAPDLADPDYTAGFNGTSSASPVVSGVIALMLEANPNLGWRDVQEILMRSARQNDSGDNDWIFNAAGFHFNHKYGAGMVDAGAAVPMAQAWANLPNQIVLSAQQSDINMQIPDLLPSGIETAFNITAKDFRTEHVTLTIDTTHSFAGDLKVTIISPSGTESIVAEQDFTPIFDYDNWKLMTVRNWGEDAEGVWRVRVADEGFGDSGRLNFLRLDIYGSSTNIIPELSISDVRIPEGDTGITNAVFDVSLSAPSSQSISVSYTTSGGTATPGTDYTPVAGALVFSSGVTNLTVSVPVVGDLSMEQNENFFVSLFNAGEAQIADETGEGIILNDDGPVWTVDDVSVVETDIGQTNVSFNVSISEAAPNFVSVGFATADGSATAGSDYMATNGTVSLFPGITNAVITIPVFGDAILETNENFFLNLTGASFSSIFDEQGEATILDDEPRIAITNLTVLEGGAGTSDAVFNVTLTKPGIATITVEYSTSNITAQATSDYTATSGILTFNPGVTNQIVSVRINGDTLHEADETFAVKFANAANALLLTNQVFGTIKNDDAPPNISITDASMTEGDSGTNILTLNVTMNTVSGLLAAAEFSTALGSASVGLDYVANSGTVIFQPGVRERTINVELVADTTFEQDETFLINLTNSLNSTIVDAQAVGTILNDDAAPTLAVEDLRVTEGDSGVTTAMVTVRVSRSSGRAIAVDYATANGTATSPDDFTASNGILNIPAASLIGIIEIPIVGDTVNEGNDAFLVNLSNATNATIADAQGEVTIVNDDGPVLSITDVTLAEGASGTTNAVFTVNMSRVSSEVVTVKFFTVDGSATAANGDYTPTATPTSLIFTSGDLVRQVSIPIVGDTTAEPNETFSVVLTNAVNATISTDTGIGTITDDDTLADVALTLSTSPAPYFVGGNLTYTIGVTNNGPFGATNVNVNTFLPTGVDIVGTTFPETSTNELDGSTSFKISALTNVGAGAVITIVVSPTNAATLTLRAAATADQPDLNIANNAATNTSVVIVPIVTVNQGHTATVVAESRVPANGSVDPGERITLAIGLKNTGNAPTVNALATMRATGGVVAPSGPQSYGVLLAGGAITTRNFSFTADGSGSSVEVVVDTVDVRNTGNVSLGSVTNTFSLPTATGFANTTSLLVPGDQSQGATFSGPASVYPSVINVSGQSGVVDSVVVTLNDMNHTFAADFDILLVSPSGEAVVLMSDAGASEDLSGVNITFDDNASQFIPLASPIVSGSYKPTDYNENKADNFLTAPAGPYSSTLSAFSGIQPNGNWSLFALDDVNGDGGSIVGGWSITLNTVTPVSSSAGLSVTISDTPDPVFVGSNLVYTVTVANDGPAAATSVTLTDNLPVGATLVSVTPSQGMATSLDNPVTIALGTIASGASATVVFSVTPNSVGVATNTVSVTAVETDLNPANNTATAETRVNRVFTLTPMVSVSPGGSFQIQLNGQGGLTYAIESSTDLVNWVEVDVQVTFDGVITFVDTNSPGMARRFYRAVER